MFFKTKEPVKLDERQQQFLLKSYQRGFWVVISLLWLQIMFGKTLFKVEETLSAIMWLGISVQVTYAIFHGDHPRLNQKYELFVLVVMSFVSLACLGCLIILGVIHFSNPFKDASDLNLAILLLTLLAMSGSFVYRIIQNHREEKE